MSKELKRAEINDKYKWDLTKIYKTEKEYEKDIKEVKKLTEKLSSYNEKVMDSSINFYNTLELYYNIMRKLDKLIIFSNLKLHEDMSLTIGKIFVGKIDKLSDETSEKIAFLTPEIMKVDFSVIEKFIEEEPRLKQYLFSLKDIFREKTHILSKEQEELLARLGEVLNASSNTYDMLENVDIVFEDIKDSNRKNLPLNGSNFGVYLRNDDRNIRKQAFDNYYKEYKKLKNTLSTTLCGNIKSDFFISKTRKYSNPLVMSLFSDNISEKLYIKLINQVNKKININYKYLDLKKKVLGLKELHMYDISAPLVKDIDNKYTYEEAVEIVKEALKPLGEKYINDLTKIINSNCIDVYPSKNKKSGAYSWGTYDTLPYILLNFEGNFMDVSTLAHELGHSMHSYYSNLNNSYQESGYTIFLAEIASTVNEVLLNKYCSDHASTKEEKMFYLNYLLELIRTTIIRQTMFAEFEKTIYDIEQSGEVLTEEIISNTYYNLNKKYYGKNIVLDEYIKYEWGRITHFYTSFYVYKYATGISIACSIVNDILNNKEHALENYMEFLKSGGNDYSLNILKKVGIDIENDDTIDKTLDLYERTIDEFNACL